MPRNRPWSTLPRDARLLLAGVAIDALGAGLALPFLVVYLHDIRGLSYQTVGLVIALPAAVALVLLAPMGALIDRFGARRVQMTALLFSCVGALVLSQADTAGNAFLANGLIGVGQAAFWPANQSLVAAIVPSVTRSRYFGLSFALLNAGIGIGGVLGAVFVDVSRPVTFQIVYVADALSFLAPFLLLAWPLRHVGNTVAHEEPAGVEAPGGYRGVLSDRVFRRTLGVVFISAFVGYGMLDSGWVGYARDVGEAGTRTIGLAFAANTAVIVLLQLTVLSRMEGHRRTRMLALLAGIWALAWAVTGLSGLVPASALGSVLLVTSLLVFGFGETLLSPIAPAITNDLAPPRLRGRYNAAASIAFQLAAISAPALSGQLIGRGLGTVLITGLVLACGVFALLSLRLERWLPAQANGVQAPVRQRPVRDPVADPT